MDFSQFLSIKKTQQKKKKKYFNLLTIYLIYISTGFQPCCIWLGALTYTFLRVRVMSNCKSFNHSHQIILKYDTNCKITFYIGSTYCLNQIHMP